MRRTFELGTLAYYMVTNGQSLAFMSRNHSLKTMSGESGSGENVLLPFTNYIIHLASCKEDLNFVMFEIFLSPICRSPEP